MIDEYLPKMNSLFFLATILLFSVNCSPARSLVDINSEATLDSFNSEIEGKSLTLRLQSGENLKPKKITLLKDSLEYELDSLKQILPITDIQSLSVTNKPSLSKIISIPLIAFGFFGIASFDTSGEIGSEAYLGAISLVPGSIILIVGNNLETKTYYFNQQIVD